MATFNGTDWTFADFSGADGYAYAENWDPFWTDVIAEMDARREDLGNALVATSSTNSVAIGAGTKTLTITTGKGFVAGMWVAATDAANSANSMVGQVTSHDPATGALTLSVLAGNTTGGGTPSSWAIGISGKPGPTPSSFAAGTVAAPGWAVTGDPDTGLAQVAGANTLSMVTGGAEAIRVEVNGGASYLYLFGATGSYGAMRLQVWSDGNVYLDNMTDGGAVVVRTLAGIVARFLDTAGADRHVTFRASTSDPVIGTSAGAVKFDAPAKAKQASVAYAATITLDFGAQDYVIGDLTGPLALANPSAFPVGQRGEILVHQDGTGGRTVSFGANWTKVGKDIVNPTAGKYSVITYWVVASGVVIYSIAGGA